MKSLQTAQTIRFNNFYHFNRAIMLAQYMLSCACVSHTGIVSKRLNITLSKQLHTIVLLRDSSFLVPKF